MVRSQLRRRQQASFGTAHLHHYGFGAVLFRFTVETFLDCGGPSGHRGTFLPAGSSVPRSRRPRCHGGITPQQRSTAPWTVTAVQVTTALNRDSEVWSTSWTVAALEVITAIVLLSVLNSLDRDGSSCHRDNFPVVIESILDRDGPLSSRQM